MMTGLCLSLTVVVQADYQVLHHFTGGQRWSTAYGSLIQSGSMLFGMTHDGGSNNFGTIFRMNTDGTGFQLIHSFVSGASDGQWPIGSLILSDSTLYGMAASAGSSYGGTLFRIGTDSSGFQVLRRFSVSDGSGRGAHYCNPPCTLWVEHLWGSTGGWNGKGTAFRINTDGTGFQVLHTFAGGANDGSGRTAPSCGPARLSTQQPWSEAVTTWAPSSRSIQMARLSNPAPLCRRQRRR